MHTSQPHHQPATVITRIAADGSVTLPSVLPNTVTVHRWEDVERALLRDGAGPEPSELSATFARLGRTHLPLFAKRLQPFASRDGGTWISAPPTLARQWVGQQRT